MKLDEKGKVVAPTQWHRKSSHEPKVQPGPETIDKRKAKQALVLQELEKAAFDVQVGFDTSVHFTDKEYDRFETLLTDVHTFSGAWCQYGYGQPRSTACNDAAGNGASLFVT